MSDQKDRQEHMGDGSRGRCDGVERSPNPCTCECEGCKYHCSAHVEMSMWEGAAVARLIPARALLNFWRVREHIEEGLCIRYYRTRRGIVVLSVKAVVA